MGEHEQIDRTPLITRKIAWDLLPHDTVEATIRELGLVLGDKDVLDLEHAESHVRLESMSGMIPMVSVYAAIASKIFGCANLPGGSIDDTTRQQFNEQNFTVIRAGVFAVLGQLLETGVLHMTDIGQQL